MGFWGGFSDFMPISLFLTLIWFVCLEITRKSIINNDYWRIITDLKIGLKVCELRNKLNNTHKIGIRLPYFQTITTVMPLANRHDDRRSRS